MAVLQDEGTKGMLTGSARVDPRPSMMAKRRATNTPVPCGVMYGVSFTFPFQCTRVSPVMLVNKAGIRSPTWSPRFVRPYVRPAQFRFNQQHDTVV